MPSKQLPPIVLLSPEIPGNTGSIGRTCLALNQRLIIIHPCGFDLHEKAVRRAGLDYWKYLQLTEYQSWEEFLSSEQPENLIAFSSHAQDSLYRTSLPPNSYLLFGPESSGLPTHILNQAAVQLKLPIINDKIRSLNLANTVTTVSYEAYRQLMHS